MKKVLIFSGTTEGRELAERLADEGIFSEVCVATEYGEQVMEPSEFISVRCGRLSAEEMKGLFHKEDFLAVVDATHPFATEVTKNIREGLSGSSLSYYRLERETGASKEKLPECFYYDSVEECVSALEFGEGNILLTTGSKELPFFCSEDSLRKRLIVRVLPGRESLDICYENGLEGKQIIAMQGPFTAEMNLATLRQFQISCLVTKESGKTGGMDAKLEAAFLAGIPCHIIHKPQEDPSTHPAGLQEILNQLIRLYSAAGEQQEGAFLEITLAGTGLGSRESETIELNRLLEQTDYLFGAPRLLQGRKAKRGSYPYYLAKDLVPFLENLQKEQKGRKRVTILFSGDTGFFSGTEKVYRSLLGMKNVKLKILPGISSIAGLSARFGISWQDALIVSGHGVDQAIWGQEVMQGVRRRKKVFFLTSGPEDIRNLGRMLQDLGFSEKVCLKVGYQLSYPQEELLELTPSQCGGVQKPGLYAVMILRKKSEETTESFEREERQITPGWRDERFIRDKVPMTKEEVREISICKLGITEDAVVFDIGSGTGSIAMEIGALSPKIRVYAIEYRQEAIDLIEKNRALFGAGNVSLVLAMAPEGLEELPVPTHAFIGGSGGRLKEILEMLYRKNPHMRVVMNAVSLESLSEMQNLLKDFPTKNLEITMVSVSKARAVGNYHLMQAGNPVTIFSFTFCDKA